MAAYPEPTPLCQWVVGTAFSGLRVIDLRIWTPLDFLTQTVYCRGLKNFTSNRQEDGSYSLNTYNITAEYDIPQADPKTI